MTLNVVQYRPTQGTLRLRFCLKPHVLEINPQGNPSYSHFLFFFFVVPVSFFTSTLCRVTVGVVWRPTRSQTYRERANRTQPDSTYPEI